MNAKTLTALDWDRLESHLLRWCHTAYGHAAITERRFHLEAEPIEALLDATAELLFLRSLGRDVPIGRLEDLSEPLGRCGRGATLNASDLGLIGTGLEILGRVRRHLSAVRSETPVLWQSAKTMTDLRPLEDELAAALSHDEDEIRSDYSPRLSELRTELRRLRRDLDRRLEALSQRLFQEGILQDLFVTQRNLRSVLPVKISHRGRVDGIVHDYSASGATIFIEPAEVLPLSNQLNLLTVQIADELRRIFAHLSTLVAAEQPAIEHDLSVLGRLDRVSAQATMAERLRGTRPSIGGRAPVFRRMRHPLLLLAKSEVTANDLILDPDTRVLVVSGPNAGGKTVLLKSVGLMVLMARFGLYLPVEEGAALPLYGQVFVELGDDQSIEDDLSTFSSHVLDLKDIIARADPRTLVLIDEIGAATDPSEGEALAAAVLERLRDQGAQVLVSTHLPGLKQLSTSAPGFASACMDFNATTLRPTYHLTLGRPGRSYALEIATSLGLPQAVVERARELQGPAARDLGTALQTLEQREHELLERIAELEHSKTDLETIRDHYLKRLEAMEEQRVKTKLRRHEDNRDELRQLRSEVSNLTRDLQARGADTGEANKLAGELAKKTAEVERQVAAVQRKTQPVDKPPRPEEIVAGATIRTARFEAVVVEPPDKGGTFTALAGSLKVRLKLREVLSCTQPVREERTPSPALLSSPASAKEIAIFPPTSATTCDLRGLDSAEALDRLDQFLDKMMHERHEYAYVIHGYGTGVLKRVCREFLASSPYVRMHQQAEDNHGGDGATYVRLDL